MSRLMNSDPSQSTGAAAPNTASSDTVATDLYQPVHLPVSRFVNLRGLRHHLMVWGDVSLASPQAPLVVMVHGWMDVGASFQFAVDALRARPGFENRPIVALDWRGFGLTENSGGDSYWFGDYLADLEFLIDELSPDQPIDLVGHSMGGNVVMLYAGLRPQRIRKLVNLEGFGMPDMPPEWAAKRYEEWFDALKKPARLKDYASLSEVAGRLKATNPLLRDTHAQWLAQHWAHEVGGRWVLNADPAHKRPQPLLYRLPEVLSFFQRITAPVLFVEGDQTLYFMFFNGKYTHAEFLERSKAVPQFTLATIQGAGHMLHHDQPEELARLMADFLLAS
jgi:pimeloyl-ACP methyl ester carboxylesterase